MKLIITLITFLLINLNSICFARDYFVDILNGSNQNSGTTPDNPWRTITFTIANIESSAEEPAIIHVAEGIYDSINGEGFPIELKSNIFLKGAGPDKTVLDAVGSETSVLFCFYLNNLFIDGITLKNGSGIEGASG